MILLNMHSEVAFLVGSIVAQVTGKRFFPCMKPDMSAIGSLKKQLGAIRAFPVTLWYYIIASFNCNLKQLATFLNK